MEITLQPELEQFIQEKITSGQYQSVNEAVNAGLKLLMERELIYQGRFAQLRQEIMVGIEASERGEVVDSETVFNSIQQKLEQRRHQAE
ncbi:MAG: type II toxin-antitoxin system ParD family antitoxin [Xenococcaceae cyanobacterium MO_207.B15]|nr:type II toxin-antitoxin system ParD family antitoxin [Xenococcaceae cyanobacterium MO_207.B15]